MARGGLSDLTIWPLMASSMEQDTGSDHVPNQLCFGSCLPSPQNCENIQMMKAGSSARNVIKSQHIKYWTVILRNTYKTSRTQKSVLLMPTSKFNYSFLCVCVCLHSHTHCAPALTCGRATVHMHRSEDNIQGLVLS